jgi:hypothetical protein
MGARAVAGRSRERRHLCRRRDGGSVRDAPGRSGRTPAGVELRAVGGEAELQVANDGARGTETTWGNGLTGLAERLAAGGGRLSAGPDGDRFVLAATVPVGVPA